MGRGSGRCCAIATCRNCSTKTEGVVYHMFPKDKQLRAQWVLKCKRSDKFTTKNSQICSIHFAPDDYERDLRNELLGLPLRKILKPNSVPSRNLSLDVKSFEPTKCQMRMVEKQQREAQKQLLEGLLNKPSDKNIKISNEIVGVGIQENSNEESLKLKAEIETLKEKNFQLTRNSRLKIKTLSSQVKYYKSRRTALPMHQK